MSEQYHNYQYNTAQEAGAATSEMQAELEAQLRLFGASVVDGVVNGFTGRSDEIGRQAKDVGSALAGVVGNKITDVLQSVIGGAFKRKPSHALRNSAGKQMEYGVLCTVFGSVFSVAFLGAGVTCLALAFTEPSGGLVMNSYILASVFSALGLGMSAMLFAGIGRVRIAKRMKHYVAVMDEAKCMPIADLAAISMQPTAVVERDLRKIVKKNWCPLWVEEAQNTLHLTLDSYRAARAQWKVSQDDATISQRERVASFILVLSKQQALMPEQEAVVELAHMQETCRDIYEWIVLHPEAEANLRRFTNYYIPTTMKLLYTYNDLQGQQGENAEQMRRDIGRFLHSLNIAFDNLQDKVLSSASLDISSEIAAFERMLAQDGLSPNQF